MNTSTRCSVT